MTRTRHFAAAIGAVALLATLAHGQAMMAPSGGTPRITQVLPLGGQAGSSFELRIIGQDLANVEGLHFNFPGVKVEVAGTETAPIDPKDKKKQPVKPPPTLLAQTFKVTLPANAPLGIQDVRVVTKAGISNPRAFVVSDHKEVLEVEPNNDVPTAQKIELNSTASGVVSTPTDVDYFAFTGKKGQRVVCSCLTTSIDSKLPAFVQVYSSSGSYLGGNRSYANNDALVDVTLPDDGEYFVRVCSFSYTLGGIDYFYRLTVSAAPWIDAVFPPVVEAGKDTQVTLIGRNLPGGKVDPKLIVNERPLEKAVVTIKASGDPRSIQRLSNPGFVQPFSSMLDGFGHRLTNEAGASNTVLMTYAQAPVVLDNGDNDDQEKAQKISTPCVIAGRIEKKGDRDWYAFEAKKGQVLHFEAFAERLGAPLDLYFQLRNSEGGLIAEQDDTLEVLSPQFFTRSDDPQKYRFSAPADGTYYLVVTSRDAFTQFGPRHLYTVSITAETPDFRLVAMATSLLGPEANTLNQSGGTAFNVYVWRFGGFNDDITLSGENLPPGVGIKPQIISGSQKQSVVVVHADSDAKAYAGAIQIVGTATVKGQKLVREVRAASISWPVVQANTPTITRLDRELVVAVRDKAPYSLIVGTQKLNVTQGDKISIPVKLVPNDGFKTNVQVVALGGPTGLIPQTLTLTPGQGGNATLDAKGGIPVPPGNYTIFLRGQTQAVNPKQPAPKGTPPNIINYSMPVSVTIVPKLLGKFTALPAAAKVSVGKSVEVTVKLARQFDLPLDVKVEAILPSNAKGITAKDVTIKAGEEEAKITFTAAPGATIGATPVITLRATAMFNDTIPIVHETKVTLAIAK